MTSRLVSLLKLRGSRLFPKRKLRIFQVITPTTPYSSKSTGRRKRSGVLGQGLGFRAFRGRAAQLTRARGRQGAGRVQGQGTQGRAEQQDSILRFSRPENLKITFLQLFEKKGEGRAGQGLGSERLGAAQHRARAKARAKGTAGCRAGRAAGAGHRGQAGLQDSILRFSRPENLKITFLQLFEKKGEGRAGQGLGSERLGAQGQGQAKGRAGCREGAGRVQGQGTEARAGLQDSILRFSRPENLKITFL